MNTNYSAAFAERYPKIAIVWDGFHLIQWFNDKVINSIRRSEANRLRKRATALQKDARGLVERAQALEAEGDAKGAEGLLTQAEQAMEEADGLLSERKLLFGERYNLLANRRTVRAKDAMNRELNAEAKERAVADGRDPSKVGHRRVNNEEALKAVLDANDKLNAAVRAREELQDALSCDDPARMRRLLEEWVATWSKAGITQLTWFTKTITRRMDGIVARADHNISSGIIEGTNTLIKNVRRQAFGMTDFDYFGYRLFEMTHLPNRRRQGLLGKVTRPYSRKKKRNTRRTKVTIFKKRVEKGKAA